MKILIITSCTGEKAVSSDQQLTRADFARGAEHVARREQELADLLRPAGEMYKGQQHVRLMRGIREIRACGADVQVELAILSAGYGFVSEHRPVAPYECTFADMKAKELRDWAEQIGGPDGFRTCVAQQYELALVLLGESYLKACRIDADVVFGGPALLCAGKASAARLPRLGNLRVVTLGNPEAKRFSCGLVGLKGELASRLLGAISSHAVTPAALADPAHDILTLLDDPAAIDAPAPARSTPRPNAYVDAVIGIPEPWWDKPHKTKLRYFIPEWDDTVDPDFDFVNDQHSGGSGDWSNEVYAHQMYPEPNYDGILVSRAVAERSKKKKKRINALGVHRFLRVPRDFPIMGDCGAFDYIMEDVPPYSTDDVIDYYTRLDFDYGVSVDHLIVKATEGVKQERFDLTVQNAEEFLREHQRRGLAWTPIGAVQGWDPDSYAEGARRNVAMGYDYIGLGGLVRTSTKGILEVLGAVRQRIPDAVSIHLFGLARLAGVRAFAELGVRSVDSASFLRRAWMGTGQNYLTSEGLLYAAIRIPEAQKSFRAKRMVTEGRASVDRVRQMERACLDAMHALDRGTLSTASALEVLVEYDNLITPERPDNRHVLRRVLEAQPWKTCPCAICQKDGIDVVIFRGNNRNRRRGFHNTYSFYRLLQRALAGEDIILRTMGADPPSSQLTLFSPGEAAG